MKTCLLRSLGLLVAALAVTVLAACQEGEEDAAEPAPTETAAASEAPTLESAIPATDAPAEITPGPGVTLWRWGNVTVLVPDDSDFSVYRYVGSPAIYPPDGGMLIAIRRGDSEVVLDANTGAVVSDAVFEADRADLEKAVASTRVDALESPESLGWPYTAGEPSGKVVERTGIRYVEPDPSTGLDASYRCGISAEPGEGCFVLLTNGRSARGVFADTGEIIKDDDNVDPSDVEAFDRWVESVQLVAR